MKIVKTHSHLNGEEYLLVHKPKLLDEIKNTIESIDAENFKTKISKEKGMKGTKLYSPRDLNKEFKNILNEKGWYEDRYSYYISTDYNLVEETKGLDSKQQKEFLIKNGVEDPIYSYKQTDFVKDNVAIEVQFGKYSFVAYDLFVKHLLFYSGGKIDVGIEILPMKSMQQDMSSGPSYFEGEVYNILRHGRTSPPVPLLIIGIAP